MNGDLVGHLSKLKNSALEFQYSDSWIEDYPSFPISRNLPVTEKVYKGEEVSNYFENLLPDSKQVREKLAANLKAGSASEFDLLSIVGKDCIGALQLVPDDWEPPQLEEAKGIELSEQEILETLNSLYNQPLGMGREEDFRISLAGNQEKTALLKINNKWLRPIGSSPTTHIFKPAMGVFDIVKGQLLDEGLSEEEIRDIMLSLTPEEIMNEMAVNPKIAAMDAKNKADMIARAKAKEVPQDVRDAAKRQYKAGTPREDPKNPYTTDDKKKIINQYKDK